MILALNFNLLGGRKGCCFLLSTYLHLLPVTFSYGKTFSAQVFVTLITICMKEKIKIWFPGEWGGRRGWGKRGKGRRGEEGRIQNKYLWLPVYAPIVKIMRWCPKVINNGFAFPCEFSFLFIHFLSNRSPISPVSPDGF